ncbi:MAG: hypothetical protein ABL974_03505 [Prosthecobacter sp.]
MGQGLALQPAILPELSLNEVRALASHEVFSTVELMCWPVGKAERKFAGVTHHDVTDLTNQGRDPLRPLVEFKSKLFHLHAALNEVGRFDFPLNRHQPRIPGYGDINWAAFMGELMRMPPLY